MPNPLRRRRRVLVTGASGFLGRHLVGLDTGWELIAPSSSALDITHRERVVAAVRDWRPEAIIHLAYRKDDPRNIVEGTRHVTEAAVAVGARLVHMSTDVVFPGRPTPYREADPTFPLNDYGRAKADAETLVAALDPSAVMVRTSLIYGTDIPGIPQTDVAATLREGRSFTFFTDEIRCPVHACDLARVLVTLAGRRDVSGALHVAGPEAIDRLSFATLIARWYGLNPAGLRGAPTPPGTARPGVVVLDSSYAAGLGLTTRPVSDVLLPVGAA